MFTMLPHPAAMTDKAGTESKPQTWLVCTAKEGRSADYLYRKLKTDYKPDVDPASVGQDRQSQVYSSGALLDLVNTREIKEQSENTYPVTSRSDDSV